MAGRVKVALELMPYHHPKLAVTAVSNISGADFASTLERAVLRSRAPLQIEHQPAERPLPEVRVSRDREHGFSLHREQVFRG